MSRDRSSEPGPGHIPLVEDQERELVWMDAPDSGLQLTEVDRAYADGVVAGEAIERHRRRDRDRLGAIATAAAIFALLVTAFWVGRATAAPRAAPVIPAAPMDPAGTEPDQELPGAPRSGMAVEDPRAEATREAPAPVGGVGAPPRSPAAAAEISIERGIASWCGPTPTHCQGWGGDAHVAGVSSFRWGDRRYQVLVCLQSDPSTCTTVTVVSYCGCPGERIIDLSPAAFGELAPLSAGLVRVTVQRIAPDVTPPATGTEP